MADKGDVLRGQVDGLKHEHDERVQEVDKLLMQLHEIAEVAAEAMQWEDAGDWYAALKDIREISAKRAVE